MCRLALQATALLSSLGCRVCIEHVPSDENPFDVLSREALQERIVKAMVDEGRWVYRELVKPTPYERLSYDSWLQWGRSAQD